MLYYYFLTLDYACTDSEPTKIMYEHSIKDQFKRFALSYTHKKYPIRCYEFKHKSKKYPEWLHYHCIVQTYLFVDFKECQRKNWSVKYIRINNLDDMSSYAGYIMKDKIDKIDINKYTCY